MFWRTLCISVDNGKGGQKGWSGGRRLGLIYVLKSIPNFVVQEAVTA